ncbi:unnamed protein product [Schistosoma bovis]|nr:unnamed protein product [Schistosoma bovis]
MYRRLLFIVSFITFSLINLSIQDVEHLRSKKLSIEYSIEQTRNQTKQDVKYAIDALDEIETLQNQFNKGISGNNKSINNFTYEFQLNIANEITKRLSKYEKLIMKKMILSSTSKIQNVCLSLKN